MDMRESKDLNKLVLHYLFAYLKGYEFEMESRTEGDSTSKVTKALAAAIIEPSVSKDKPSKQLSNDAMSLFVKKFEKFLRKNKRNFQSSSRKNHYKKESMTRTILVSTAGELSTLKLTAPNQSRTTRGQLISTEELIIRKKDSRMTRNHSRRRLITRCWWQRTVRTSGLIQNLIHLNQKVPATVVMKKMFSPSWSS